MTPAFILGIGAVGPGFANWSALAAILRGETVWAQDATPVAAPALLPPAERRRVGMAIKLALAVGVEAAQAAGRDIKTLPTVFTSSGGDGENCHSLCEALAGEDRFISPTRFHNSVHNAPSGYWSIAAGCMASSTSLCAHDGSLVAGLLEAMTQLAAGVPEVLLIAHDSPYPEPLARARPIAGAMGLALLLGAAPVPGATRIEAELTDAAASTTDGDIDALRPQIPVARALPLLQMIARGQHGQVVLDYLDASRLAVRCT